MPYTVILRLCLLLIGLLFIGVVFWLGRSAASSAGRRRADSPESASPPRQEPTLSSVRSEGLARSSTNATPVNASQSEGADSATTTVGERVQTRFDKIVTLFVAAKGDQLLCGEDIVVAAEKTGLVFGHLDIFHRLMEGHPERGPIFSMASILKPGSFDMTKIRDISTPAVAFFMTLPAPLPALDAWEKMLPTVQRMAELLDGHALDDSRNPLGRQRIAHIRDELRAYDRQQQADLAAASSGHHARW